MAITPKIFLDLSIERFNRVLDATDESLSSLRRDGVLARGWTDRISVAEKDARDTVPIPQALVVNCARRLNVSPVDIVETGAVAKVAREHPDQVPMIDLYAGEGHTDSVALPIGFQAAKQIASLASPSELVPQTIQMGDEDEDPKRIKMEQDFFNANPGLQTPRLNWGYAVSDDDLVKNSVLLEKLAESVSAEKFDPDLGFWGNRQGGMKAMISSARQRTAETADIPPDLNFAKEGLRVFHCFMEYFVRTKMNFFETDMFWTNDDDPQHEETEAFTGAYEFVSYFPVPIHRLIVGPANAPFVYVRMPPKFRELQMRVETDLFRGGETYAGMDISVEVNEHQGLLDRAAELGLLEGDEE